jgi:hypothetical protein
MRSASGNAEWVLSADALKLIAIVGVFIWLAFPLLTIDGIRDFSVLYTAGSVIVEGHRTQLFDVATQSEFQHRAFKRASEHRGSHNGHGRTI